MNETLELALDALQKTQSEGYNLPATAISEAITAIEAALAQPIIQNYLEKDNLQQEPVAWDGDCVLGHCGSPTFCEEANCCCADYTPPQRTWVGLTDEEITKIFQRNGTPNGFARAIEKALKEKNT